MIAQGFSNVLITQMEAAQRQRDELLQICETTYDLLVMSKTVLSCRDDAMALLDNAITKHRAISIAKTQPKLF